MTDVMKRRFDLGRHFILVHLDA